MSYRALIFIGKYNTKYVLLFNELYVVYMDNYYKEIILIKHTV